MTRDVKQTVKASHNRNTMLTINRHTMERKKVGKMMRSRPRWVQTRLDEGRSTGNPCIHINITTTRGRMTTHKE